MKKFLQWVIALALVALCVCLICQAVYFGNLDHSMQLEANGFYKNDVTMLTFGQQCARNCCWVFGVLSGIGGLGAIGIALGFLEL